MFLLDRLTPPLTALYEHDVDVPVQEQLVQQCGDAAAMLLDTKQQRQQQQPPPPPPLQPLRPPPSPYASTAVQSLQEQPLRHHAVDPIQLSSAFGSPALPSSPSPVGNVAWWLDDSTLRYIAKFNRLDAPLVLTVDAEPITLSHDEVSMLACRCCLFLWMCAPFRVPVRLPHPVIMSLPAIDAAAFLMCCCRVCLRSWQGCQEQSLPPCGRSTWMASAAASWTASPTLRVLRAGVWHACTGNSAFSGAACRSGTPTTLRCVIALDIHSEAIC